MMIHVLSPTFRNAAPLHGWVAQLCASGMQSPFQCPCSKKILRRCDEEEIRDDEKYWKSVQQKQRKLAKITLPCIYGVK
jgi:hypothetical protein